MSLKRDLINNNIIVNNISVALDTLYPDSTIYTDIVNQDLKDVSFFINFINSNINVLLGNKYTLSTNISIKYFTDINSQTKNNLLRDIGDNLSYNLNIIKINNEHINRLRGSNIYYEILDNTLHFFVTYTTNVIKTTEEIALMEQLTQNTHLKER